MKTQGKDDLAEAIKELTEAVIESNELDEAIKKDIAEQLEYLVLRQHLIARIDLWEWLGVS